MTLVAGSIAPAAAAPWTFLDGTFGNSGDGSGSIEAHDGGFYYSNGPHGVEGHPPHEVWIYPYSFFTKTTRPGPETHLIHAHVTWCTDHYRSYRHSDNSFRSEDGRRRACRSPYWH